jgi:protein TonB
MNALNLRNGGAAAGSAPRVMPAGAIVGWEAPGAEAAAGRHRNAKFIVGLLAIVGVICVVLFFNIRKAPAPQPPAAPSRSSESQFESLAEKVAQEKPAPVVQPPAPPPVVEPVKTKPVKKGHGAIKATTKASASPATPTPTSPDAASLARLKDSSGARTPQLQPNSGSASRPPPSQPDIMRVVSNNKTAIQACYQRALLRDSSLTRGKINVHLTIGISGRVKQVQLETQGNFRTVEPCIREVVGRWVFPAASDSYETEFPFVFQGRE